MKRWKKLLLLLLAAALLSQIPFAYRRYKLGKLSAAIQQLNSERTVSQTNSNFVEFKGVLHVHSFLGGHSNGGFDEIIAAAKSNGLNFVIMTEHTSDHFSTSDMTLKGTYGGVLFVNGNEAVLANSDRLLLVPGVAAADLIIVDVQDSYAGSLNDIATRGRGDKGLTFVAYPEKFSGWDTNFYDGIEIYNIYTNAQQINSAVIFFDALWSYRSYPDLLFANFYRRPAESLRRWDQVIAKRGRSVVGIAGNDAHSNVGISLVDSSGNTLVGFKLDPYERSFRLVRLHVLLPAGQELSRDSLLAALKAGHAFIAFDLFGDSSGFSFSAANGTDARIQGDEIQLNQGVQLTVNTPVSSRILLLRDGTPIQDDSGLSMKTYSVTEKGSYRVEVYLPQLGKPVGEQPWIISNPVYVK